MTTITGERTRGSEVQDYLRCRLRWRYRWADGLKAKRPNGKLFFGNMFHKFVEQYYLTGDVEKARIAMNKLYNDTDTTLMEQVELDELYTLSQGVVDNYVEQWGSADSFSRTLAVELHFAVPLDDNIIYDGTIDRIYIEAGELWFTDHKTTNTIEKYEKNAEMDRQISRYWWAIQQLQLGNGFLVDEEGNLTDIKDTALYKEIQGKTISGFVYDIVLRDFPKPPKELKSGGLSKDKSQKTTHKVYLQALKDKGLLDDYGNVPDEYKDILENLLNQETSFGNRYFRRVPVQRLQPEVDAAIEEFYFQAREVLRLRELLKQGKGQSTCYRNINNDCSWDCDFKALCLASMDGSNVDMLIDLAYEKVEVK